MWSAFLRFLGWLMKQAWRLASVGFTKIVNYAKSHWREIAKMVMENVAFEAILRWICMRLGMGC